MPDDAAGAAGAPAPNLAELLRRTEIATISDEDRRQASAKTKFDREKRIVYLQLIRSGVRRIKAAAMVGIGYSTVREYMLEHPEFLAGVEEAEATRVDEVEEALYRTAIDGSVPAQLAVLQSRRADEWGGRKLVGARGVTTGATEEGEEELGVAALTNLRSKLDELSKRLQPEAVKADAAPEPEPEEPEAE